jgi:hypothetical protein
MTCDKPLDQMKFTVIENTKKDDDYDKFCKEWIAARWCYGSFESFIADYLVPLPPKYKCDCGKMLRELGNGIRACDDCRAVFTEEN